MDTCIPTLESTLTRYGILTPKPTEKAFFLLSFFSGRIKKTLKTLLMKTLFRNFSNPPGGLKVRLCKQELL